MNTSTESEFDLAAVYHEVVQPLADVLQYYLFVPKLWAPVLALAVGFFVPLYFVAAKFFHTWGYSGNHLCAPSSSNRAAPCSVFTTLSGLSMPTLTASESKLGRAAPPQPMFVGMCTRCTDSGR